MYMLLSFYFRKHQQASLIVWGAVEDRRCTSTVKPSSSVALNSCSVFCSSSASVPHLNAWQNAREAFRFHDDALGQNTRLQARSVLPLELLNAVYQDNDISPHNPNSKTVRKVPFLSLISGSAPVSCPNRTVCWSASDVRCRGACVR